jgi:hypothetical protein
VEIGVEMSSNINSKSYEKSILHTERKNLFGFSTGTTCCNSSNRRRLLTNISLSLSYGKGTSPISNINE